jgi:hypothetical protein
MATEITKALTSSTASALIPENLDPVLKDELLNLAPLLELLDIAPAEGKTHEYNVASSHPSGWFEGEAATASVQSGTYTRKTVQMKIIRIWGEVTGFAQRVTARFINALEREIMNSLEGMADAMEFMLFYGCAGDYDWTGDAYQASGILPIVYSEVPTNVHDFAGAKVTLAALDTMLYDIGRYRGVRNDPRLFVMGLKMKQVVDGLQTKVQLPLSNAELLDGRIVMRAYGDTPIYEAYNVTPQGTTTSPTVSTATPASGGAFAAADYDWQIASVTSEGEQVAGTAVGATTLTLNQKATLAWTADANAKSYMIFRQDGGTGDFKLIDIIAAKTYGATGVVTGTVASYEDLGSATGVSQVTPLASGEEIIVALNINPERGLGIRTLADDMGLPAGDGDISPDGGSGYMFNFVELARTKDAYAYFIKTYVAPRLVHPNLVSVTRNVKIV